MNIDDLLHMRAKGAIATRYFVGEVIALLTEENVDMVLGAVPKECIPSIRVFVEGHKPGGQMFSIGGTSIPTDQQFYLAQKWLLKCSGR